MPTATARRGVTASDDRKRTTPNCDLQCLQPAHERLIVDMAAFTRWTETEEVDARYCQLAVLGDGHAVPDGALGRTKL